jgi:hypothetical protein
MHLRSSPNTFASKRRRMKGAKRGSAMKTIAIFMAAAAAMAAMSGSPARSQDACSKNYVACMDHCATKTAKSVQEPCINSCQSNNNRCAEQVYGGRREMDPPGQTAGTRTEGKKALAKEAAPPPRKVDVAPRKAEKNEAPEVRKVDIAPRRKNAAPAPAHEPAQAPAADPAPAQEEPRR